MLDADTNLKGKIPDGNVHASSCITSYLYHGEVRDDINISFKKALMTGIRSKPILPKGNPKIDRAEKIPDPVNPKVSNGDYLDKNVKLKEKVVMNA